jgi:hypothetical protein
VRPVRGPVSPKQDTLGDWGGEMPLRHCWYSLGSISRLLSSSKGRSHPKGDSHDKHILMLTADTVALVCGGIPARAQEDSDDHPAITRHWEEAQQNQGDEEDTGVMGPA